MKTAPTDAPIFHPSHVEGIHIPLGLSRSVSRACDEFFRRRGMPTNRDYLRNRINREANSKSVRKSA